MSNASENGDTQLGPNIRYTLDLMLAHDWMLCPASPWRPYWHQEMDGDKSLEF